MNNMIIKFRAIHKTASFFVALLFLLCVFSLSTHAATSDQQKITLSPPDVHYVLKAGETQSGTFIVLNHGKTDYDFLVYAKPYTVKDASYTQFQIDDNGTDARADAYKWITFEKATYHAKAGEMLEIPYTITVPSTVSSGSHTGVVFAETQPASGSGSGVITKKRVGMIVYINAEGTLTNQGRTASISLPALQTKTPLTSHVTVENTGNTYFVTHIQTTVSSLFGKKYVDDGRDYTILPEKAREITLMWDKVPAFGVYTATVKSTVLGKDVSKSTTVFMVPLWVFALLLVGVFAGVAFAVRRHERKASVKTGRRR